MDPEERKTEEVSGMLASPINEQKKSEKTENKGFKDSRGYSATNSMLLSALLSYAAGWLFVRSFICTHCYESWPIPILGAVLTFWVLWAARGRKVGKEHFIWLGVLWCCIFHATFFWHRKALLFGVHVWDEASYPMLFCVPVAAYWVLSRFGLLSGSLLLDGTRALIVLPFSGFFDRLRWVKQFFRSYHQGLRGKLLMWLLSLGIGLIFLVLILPVLGRADESFAALLEKAVSWMTMPKTDGGWILRVPLSLPVGAWLYGLIARSTSADMVDIADRNNDYTARLEKLRRLPVACHCVTLTVFILIYCLFFYEQSGNLFTALRDRLAPDSLTMSSYAVNGFSDLCRVMGLTLALALVTVSTTDRPLTENRVGRVLLTVLLVQSLLFAVSAGAKLYLYLLCFGYTSLRLRAAWAILVMSAAAVCGLLRVWGVRHTLRPWCIFTGVTLALTMLI